MSHHVSCNDCSLSPICLPLAVAPAQLDQLDRIIHRGRPLKRGEHLFRATDRFDSVYAVRSGALKTYVVSDDGEEQVTGFYLPGEVLGMDGISTARHVSNAKALETATVCEIPFDRLDALTQTLPEIARLGFLERCQHRTPLDGGFWYGYCGQVHERPAERAPDGTWSCGHHLRFHLDPPGAGAPHVSPSQEDPASDLPRQASGDARPHGGDAPRGGGEDRPPG
mgnify:CR=1 FL=1